VEEQGEFKFSNMNKKGVSIGDLYPVVLTILLVGIVLGVGMFVILETSDAVVTTTQTVTNESVAAVTEAGVYVATSTYCGFHDFAVTSVINHTDVTLKETANYSYDADTGRIWYEGGQLSDGVNNTDWNVTYTYTGQTTAAGTGACAAMLTTNTGVGGLADWIAVIVVVLAAAIVLGIVISSFGKNQAV